MAFLARSLPGNFFQKPVQEPKPRRQAQVFLQNLKK
jgi:hypothetical protein